MLTLDATALARAAASVRGACVLVEADFSTGLERVTTWNATFPSGGFNWTALGTNLRISAPRNSEEGGSQQQLEFSVAIADSAMFAKAMGPASVYRNRVVRLYFQLMDEAGMPAGAYVRFWHGYMRRMYFDRVQPDPSGKRQTQGGSIRIVASKAGAARSRRFEGMRISHAQRIQQYPGDLGYEYMQSLIEQPALWLSKRFQEVQQ